MSNTNPNYQQTPHGWERKPNAPNVTTPSHIKWDRMQSIQNIREGVKQQRERQNQINQQHREKHGNG